MFLTNDRYDENYFTSNHSFRHYAEINEVFYTVVFTTLAGECCEKPPLITPTNASNKSRGKENT
jgi:hypothetical protein